VCPRFAVVLATRYLACTVIRLTPAAMGEIPRRPHNTPMHTYPYENFRGHIIVKVNGAPWLVDTGSPFSVGYAPVVIAGREFEVQEDYLDVCPAWLTEHIGTSVDGLIGADILSRYTVCFHRAERRLEFSSRAPGGDIVLPLKAFMDVPILPVEINGRVLRAFFDTGAPLSYLLPEQLDGLAPEGQREDFYPLLGHFLTDLYTLSVGIGGEERQLRFGELPTELHSMLDAGQVQAIIGTELLDHFCLCFSVTDRVMMLNPPPKRAIAAALSG
jgi:hypothetical protein